MNEINQPLSRLEIPAQKRTRRWRGPVLLVGAVALIVVAGLLIFVSTGRSERKLVPSKGFSLPADATTGQRPAVAARSGEPLLTVSGYIIPRARIEISPRFQGTVKWIGVKKGDRVKKDEVLVQLEDDEFRARLLEAQGRLALAEANLANAEVNLKRQLDLASSNVDSQRAADDARRTRDAAAAEMTMARGQLALAQTYVDWCTISAPIDGTILEKLVDPNELVVPQSFGGSRGPSTAFVAMADLSDLQVEIDLNEADLAKVHLKQACRVSPEAYPDRIYRGFVAEIAPEANRQKGTLQIKVQIEQPDEFLTPELTAKVDFLAD
jgi:HlyD family secretion protein